MKYQDENAFDVKEQIRENNVAILPVGAVEAHGPHLPLGTDNILAERLATKLAERVNGYELPLLPFGQVWSLKEFPGSLNVSNQSMVSLLTDIGTSLHRQGFRVFVMLNTHLGNATALKEAARELFEICPELKVFYFFYPGMNEVAHKVREKPAAHGSYVHADEIETSLMLYLAEEYVDMSKAIDDTPKIPENADVTPTPWGDFTETAVLGDATLATKEKGKQIIDTALAKMAAFIEEAK